MRSLIGCILILLGIVAGLYVGCWVMFYGGILQIVDQCNANVAVASQIAFGVLKIIFSGFAGWVVFYFFVFLGRSFLESSKSRNSRIKIKYTG